MSYIYDKTNPDWEYEHKFMGGFTENPIRRKEDGHSEHSHLSLYKTLYKVEKTDEYKLGKGYLDRIIFDYGRDPNKIKIAEDINQCELPNLRKIKKHLVENNGSDEFIYISGRDIFKKIILEDFPKLGIRTSELTKEEVEEINNKHTNHIREKKQKTQKDILQELLRIEKEERDKKIRRDKQSIKDEIKWFERDYQRNIIQIGGDKLTEIGKFYLELATGGGKSYIVFKILKQIKPDTIVIFTPRKIINKQNISNKYLSILDENYNIYDQNSNKSFDKVYKPGKNIIVACIQSYETIYEYLTTYGMGDVFIWFDEAHWMVENWTNVKNDGNTIIQYFLKSSSIKYKMFTSASPNHDLIKRNESIFGQLCSPIKVKQLIGDKWLCPILPHIFETNNQNANVIQYCLQHFTKYQKSWGFSFHNNCINAGALFKIHYELYKNKLTTIKPFIDVSTKELDLSDIRLNYDYTDIKVFENIKNSMAYVVQKYSMGYDFEKIDYLTFCDPKSSYKDIIQCIGRGTRPDKLGENGTNLEKKLHIMLPIYMDQMEMDKSPYETISEVLRYLIYDIELDPLEDIEFVEAKKLGGAVVGTDYRGGDDTRAILLDLLKGGKYSSIKKPDLIQMLKDKDIHDNSSYYRLKENRPDLQIPELFSAFPDFTFEETYDNCPYYSKQECIEKIKNIMELNDIDGDDEDIDYYNEIDSRIPDQALFHFYGGCRNDYPCY